jgi:hypothetical protein
MNDITKGIQKAVEKSVTEFMHNITKKYENVEMKELEALWAHFEITPKTSPNSGCVYIYSKGQKRGQRCGVKLKPDTQYCSIHKKYEGMPSKPIKILPVPKKNKKDVTKDTTRCLLPYKDTAFLFHRETQLIFKNDPDSTPSYIVFGKLKGDDIEDLTDTDIEICKKWSFAYEDIEECIVDLENNPVPKALGLEE